MCVSLQSRNFYHDHNDWRRAIEKGCNAPRFVGVAAYKKSDVKANKTYYAPYMLPWIIKDIDRGGDKKEAWNVCYRILEPLYDFGCDMRKIRVINTAGDGFHIATPCGMIGSPVFSDRRYAGIVYSRMFLELFDDDIDHALFNPSQIVRIPGSIHEKTGGYCVSYTAEEFIRLRFNQVLEDSAAGMFIGRMGDPIECPIYSSLKDLFMDMWKDRKKIRLQGYTETKEQWQEKKSGIICRIEEGVYEGETWWKPRGYQGRSLAMFIYGQEMLRRGHSDYEVWEILKELNKLNDPPLPITELKGRLKSAKRSHARRNSKHNLYSR